VNSLDDLNAALADAMRQHDRLRLGTLRMLKAALMNREVERSHSLSPAEGRQVVISLIKQRRDSIEQFTRGGRQDLADKEAAEIVVLESYLPAPTDPAAIDRVIADVIAETAASSPKDFGRVMKAVMAKLLEEDAQNVDGKVISDRVRSRLNGS
jgi:uncharacterized protein YqeY